MEIKSETHSSVSKIMAQHDLYNIEHVLHSFLNMQFLYKL